MPFDQREELRAWLVEKEREDSLSPSEAASLEQFRKELHGAAAWVRAEDRRLIIRILRMFGERA